MDLGSLPPELITGVAQDLTSRALSAVGIRIRRQILGTDKERAVQEAYRQGIEFFVASLPDSLRVYGDAIEAFLTDDVVATEFALLLEASSSDELNLELLRNRFEELGFDFTTTPNFSFERAIQSFVMAFTRAAAADQDLRSILSYHSLQRIEARLTTILALQQESAEGFNELQNLLVSQQQAVPSLSAEEEATTSSRYRYPSQQFIRYISLAVDERIPEPVVTLIQGLAMTSENWIQESTDTIEFVLDAEDYVSIFEIIGRMGQHSTQEGRRDPVRLMRMLAAEAVRELQTTIRLRRENGERPLPALARQMQESGVPYIVLGVEPRFAGFIEAIRTILHPNAVSIPARVRKEIHFESYEDANDVFSRFQRAIANAGGDNERFIMLLVEEVMERAIDRALPELGLDDRSRSGLRNIVEDHLTEASANERVSPTTPQRNIRSRQPATTGRGKNQQTSRQKRKKAKRSKSSR